LRAWKREAEKRTFFFMPCWREGFILNIVLSVNYKQYGNGGIPVGIEENKMCCFC
jgi:hypothetical protein